MRFPWKCCKLPIFWRSNVDQNREAVPPKIRCGLSPERGALHFGRSMHHVLKLAHLSAWCETCANQRWLAGKAGKSPNYPLVICYIAIEHGHRNSGFTHWKWWFSIVMLIYQRVNGGLWWLMLVEERHLSWLAGWNMKATNCQRTFDKITVIFGYSKAMGVPVWWKNRVHLGKPQIQGN